MDRSRPVIFNVMGLLGEGYIQKVEGETVYLMSLSPQYQETVDMSEYHISETMEILADELYEIDVRPEGEVFYLESYIKHKNGKDEPTLQVEGNLHETKILSGELIHQHCFLNLEKHIKSVINKNE
ncbi:hypothetical protein [Bacillus toyonensis]|uniref:hypothetical protein n=1 Tax=Bacillus toyonensis TaxID=155322 RepID=UPI000BF89DBA|nr:hypothetical protein [Bacillus toyonensis]PGF04993.1 hypothetical protein COM61_00720 [Bacillus toyonensis]